MNFDLSRFRDTFFEESLEGLAEMEAALLDLDPDDVDAELIDTIFRAAHSIKGGAGTFGLTAIGDFTHLLETLLDQLRDGSRQVTAELVDLLLRGNDCIRGMFDQIMGDPDGPPQEFEGMVEIMAEVTAILEGGVAGAEADSAGAGDSDGEAASEIDADPEEDAANEIDAPSGDRESADSGGTPSGWHISFRPYQGLLQFGNEPVRMFRELAELGELTADADHSALLPLEDIDSEACYLNWELTLLGAASREDVMGVFEWVEDDCDLEITQLFEGAAPSTVSEEEAPPTSAVETPDVVEADADLEATQEVGTEPAPEVEDASEPELDIASPAETQKPVDRRSASRADRRAAGNTDRRAARGDRRKDGQARSIRDRGGSLRVPTHKIDSLVNLVGEMVIVQSMLGEIGEGFEMSRIDDLRAGLEQLEQSTRTLQESVMQVRMEPIGHAFQPMPRVVHDLCKKLGKEAQLTMSGEMTELDKTVAERISDSLMHLVRNALDHGIESPEDRELAGKNRMGTVHLGAEHRGGQIVIEVKDDGAGLDPERIRAKAISQGLLEPGDKPSDAEIFDLIFHAGLTTATEVSDVSGRGVGMDVVRRNVRALGGTIGLKSKAGDGTSVTIQLPLTLAIVEGQVIRLGQETYIIPLLSIIESVHMVTAKINWVPNLGPVYRFRGEQIRVIRLAECFGVEPDSRETNHGMLVIIEGDGQVAGLVVDELLAHRQIVVKNLDNNHEEVEGIGGATILGDGTVALILNIGGLINMKVETQMAYA